MKPSSNLPASAGTQLWGGGRTRGVILSFGLRLGLGLYLAGDGADDAQLGKEGDALCALEVGGAASKVVNATQADLGLFRLEDHDVALRVGHGDASLLVKAPNMKE